MDPQSTANAKQSREHAGSGDTPGQRGKARLLSFPVSCVCEITPQTDANANAFANRAVHERLAALPRLANKQRTNVHEHGELFTNASAGNACYLYVRFRVLISFSYNLRYRTLSGYCVLESANATESQRGTRHFT